MTTKDQSNLADRLAKVAADIFDLAQGSTYNTDQIKALIVGYVDEVAESLKPGYHVPGPYEIALTVGAALAASGHYETPGAALHAAWMAVPEFYTGRDAYLRELAPIMFGASRPEGRPDERASDPH